MNKKKKIKESTYCRPEGLVPTKWEKIVTRIVTVAILAALFALVFYN